LLRSGLALQLYRTPSHHGRLHIATSLLTNPRSQNQEDIPHSRPRLVLVHRPPHPNLPLPLVVRNRTLVHRQNNANLHRREGRLARHANQHRCRSRHALRRPTHQHARCGGRPHARRRTAAQGPDELAAVAGRQGRAYTGRG